MRVRWPKFLVWFPRLLTSRVPHRNYELRPAMDFEFRRRPQGDNCFDRTPGQPRQPGVYVTWPGQQPYIRSRCEDVTVPHAEIPALTITANTGEVSISGAARPDWSLRFLAYGDGGSEAEAFDRLRQFSFTRIGSTISIDGRRFEPKSEAHGRLEVKGPTVAPITVQGSFASVQVCDMSGPVQVGAIHGRARILDTTGRVAASGSVVDFAGSQGVVTLSAEREINVKFTGVRFDGTMTACAQRTVRVLVPRGFRTPFQAFVSRPRDFVCRTEFRKKIKRERSGGLHVFKYDGDGSTPPENVDLRSEHGKLVIDDTITSRKSAREFRQSVFEDYT